MVDFSCQSICSVISSQSGMSTVVQPQEFLKVDVDHGHISVSTLYTTFCSKLTESVGMMAYVVWLSPLKSIQRKAWCGLIVTSRVNPGEGMVLSVTSWVNPAEGMVWSDSPLESIQRRAWMIASIIHCQDGGWGCTAFKDGGRTLLDSEALPSMIGLWWLSHQCTFWLWDLAVCSFLEWEAWSLSLAGAATSMIFVATKHIFCRDKSTLVATKLLSRQKSYLWQLPPMIDLRLHFARWPFSTVLSEVFGQQVSHRDAEINLGTFPTSGFVWAVSTGILAVLSPLLDPPKTCHVPVCFPLCLSRLRGVGCRYFWRHWCMFCPDPLSVWFTLVGGLAWTSWSRWVCP